MCSYKFSQYGISQNSIWPSTFLPSQWNLVSQSFFDHRTFVLGKQIIFTQASDGQRKLFSHKGGVFPSPKSLHRLTTPGTQSFPMPFLMLLIDFQVVTTKERPQGDARKIIFTEFVKYMSAFFTHIFLPFGFLYENSI